MAAAIPGSVWLLGLSRGRPDGARPGWRPGPSGGPASAGPCCGGPSVGTSRGFGFGSILRPIRQDGYRCSDSVENGRPETGGSTPCGRFCFSLCHDSILAHARCAPPPPPPPFFARRCRGPRLVWPVHPRSGTPLGIVVLLPVAEPHRR